MKNLKKCPKCGNIMALRTFIEDSEKKRVLQCFVCRYWEPVESEKVYFLKEFSNKPKLK
jgi:DNA-directed RNA polymerase subunit M/transcription elongation factor TFIIS